MKNRNMILLLCPHADDELIGCWSILQNRQPLHIIYTEQIDTNRLKEVVELAKVYHFNFDILSTEKRISAAAAKLASEQDLFILAPDPHWENHPAHKKMGALGRTLAEREQCRFGTYSTNMNVPYLRELTKQEQEKKKSILDEFFPSQKSLWKHDYRYFLFEGIIEWGITHA